MTHDHQRIDAVEWPRVSRMLDGLLDLEPCARAAALDDACHGDAALRARVQALLDADERAGCFLEGVPDHAAVDLPGVVFGRYRTTREIGHGGMGRVFLAERADGAFDQTVAIKVVRREIDTVDGHARFLRERQILARLEHRNIARLLDGGISSDGRPFFAMEYVDGEPMMKFAADRRLGVDGRVALMLDVCEGVRAAHRHLIVHRDLKPSNVLVTSDGAVKLLDFGIAKLLEDEPDGTLTRLGSGPLTPEFAAPEQILGQPITTATDVYALGALLYELLAGQNPHQFTTRSPVDIERTICKQPIVPPSAVAPVDTRRQIRGDLDTIVLRALEKDPARRYASVEALAEDLRRYRAGRPILARRPTYRYRARRFVQRHAVAVAAGVLLALSLLAGAAASLWQARIATAEAARSRETARFLTRLFDLSSPEQSLGRAITARELLDRAAQRIDSELSGQPDLQGEMLTILGTLHHQLGMFDQAAIELRRAAEIRRSLGSDDQLATTLVALANALSEDADGTGAEAPAQEALAMRQRMFGEIDERTAAAWEAVGAAFGAQGRGNQQIDAHQHSVTIRRHLGQPEPLARGLSNLGMALSNAGQYERAAILHREALDIRRRILPANHPDIASSLDNRAAALAQLGALADAADLQREALAIRRTVYGEVHPFVALSLNNLGVRMDQLGHRDEAERLHQLALAVRRKTLGDDHPQTIQSVNGLAIAAFRRGDLEGALEGFREASDRWTRTLGPLHPHTLTATGSAGVVLTELGALQEAERLLRDVVSRRRQAQGSAHPDVGVAMRQLGVTLHRAGRLAEAEQVLVESVRRHREGFPPRHLRASGALLALGAVLRDQGRSTLAEPLLREALEIRTDAIRTPDERLAEAQRELGACLAALGRRYDAERLLLSSYDIVHERPGAERHAAHAARALAEFYRRSGDSVREAQYRR
jgi:tetratricopeptide (TPR) repeat protein/predicted Ser/Thr protein kinase